MKSIKLAKLTAIDLNVTKTSKAGKPYNVAHIEYTQPQGEDTTRVFTADIFHGTLKENPAMKAAIVTLAVGSEIGIEKTQDGMYWPITGFVAAADVPAPKPAYNGGGGFSKSSPRDTAGIKVGAVLHDATSLAIAQKKDLVTVSDVLAIAEQLLATSYALEGRVRAGEFEGSTTPSVGVKKEVLATTPAEAVALLNDKIDSLDDTSDSTSNTMGSLPF